MYVSYGYTVAIFVAVFILVKVILGQSLWTALIVLGIILVAGGPYLFRLSNIKIKSGTVLDHRVAPSFFNFY